MSEIKKSNSSNQKNKPSERRVSDDRRAALKRAALERAKIEKRKRRKKFLISYSILLIILVPVMFFILSHMSSDKEDLREKGIVAYKNNSYAEAAELFTASLAEEQWFTKEMDLDTRIYLGDCYMQLNRYQDAYSVYMELKSLNEGNYSEEYLDSLIGVSSAMVDMQNGDYDSASTYLAGAINNGNTAMFLYLGACYSEMGDYENMMDCFGNYLISHDMNTYIAYQYSTYFINAGNYETAKNYIDRGLSAGDDVYLEQVKYNEIVYYEMILDYETAFSKAEAFIGSYPENEAGRNEYEFLNTRVNIDPTPVHSTEETNTITDMPE